MRRAALERLAAEVEEYTPAPKATLTVVPDLPLNRRQARIAQHTRVPARYLPAPALPKRPGPGVGASVGIGLGRLAVAATRGAYQCHRLIYSSLWEGGRAGKTLAVAVAVTEVAALGHAVGVEDPAVRAPETHQTHHPHTRHLEPTKPTPSPSPRRRHTEAHHEEPRHPITQRPGEHALVVDGVTIPPLENLTHAQSVHATNVLMTRGPNYRNRAIVMRDLMDRGGFKDFQASAYIGGFQKETGYPSLPPSRMQEGGPALGIVMWENPRKARFLAFAAARHRPWTDLQVQLDFIHFEMLGPEKHGADWMRSTTSLPAAYSAAINGYERPQDRTQPDRLQFAANWLTVYYQAARS